MNECMRLQLNAKLSAKVGKQMQALQIEGTDLS